MCSEVIVTNGPVPDRQMAGVNTKEEGGRGKGERRREKGGGRKEEGGGRKEKGIREAINRSKSSLKSVEEVDFFIQELSQGN